MAYQLPAPASTSSLIQNANQRVEISNTAYVSPRRRVSHTFYMTPCGSLTTIREDHRNYDRQQLAGENTER